VVENFAPALISNWANALGWSTRANSRIGHRREDLTFYPVLIWPVGSYLIIYRAERRPLDIVAVTQGSRDIPAFLSRRIHT